MSKPKRKRKLNPKQQDFVEQYTNPKSPTFSNGTKTARAVGYAGRSAENQAHRLMRNDEVSNEIQRVLDAAGATEERCAEVLRAGLEAKDTKVFCQEGEVVYSEALIDFAERRLTATEVLKLRGRYPTNRTIERIESLRIQNTLIVVPAVAPAEERRERPTRQLTD